MHTLSFYLDGIGLLGPGLSGWSQARDVLRGDQAYAMAPTLLPAADKLPAAERRRVGAPVKLSLAIGLEAAAHANADLTQLAAVFSSSEGDCDNSHAILETLASSDRALSPTRFHNAVHNAPSGYWGIATGSMQPCTSLCAYDATFAAGLLEAATQVAANGQPCMLLAYDTAFPEPLNTLRPIPHAMGVALVLSAAPSAASLAQLSLVFTSEAITPMPAGAHQRALEDLRQHIPAARSLPLLNLLARATDGRVVLDYLDGLQLEVDVKLCR